jgi:hypothetical protein
MFFLTFVNRCCKMPYADSQNQFFILGSQQRPIYIISPVLPSSYRNEEFDCFRPFWTAALPPAVFKWSLSGLDRRDKPGGSRGAAAGRFN